MENLKKLVVERYYEETGSYQGSFEFNGRKEDFYLRSKFEENRLQFEFSSTRLYFKEKPVGIFTLISMIEEYIRTHESTIAVVKSRSRKEVFNTLKSPIEELSTLLDGKSMKLDDIENLATEIIDIVRLCRSLEN